MVLGAGARLTGRGRLLIRISGAEPLIRVMPECGDEAMLAEVADGILAAGWAALCGAARCGTGGWGVGYQGVTGAC